MIIRKIEVKGAGKKSAILEFKEGLNVIAGASDTGKSYITKCFQFIFGAETPPKQIEQASGYTHLEVTFEQHNGTQRFVLSRELNEKSDITLIDIDNEGTKSVLKPSHKGYPNLSEFFLSKFGLNDKVLAKGTESMNHSSLTMRILEKVFLVDEERIISENSPLGKGQNTEKTIELSLIKTLLTGDDDSAILEAKEDKQSKTGIKQKLHNFEDFLEKFFPVTDESEASLQQLDETLEALEASYEQAERELNQLLTSNNELVHARTLVRRKAEGISRTIDDDSVLIDRFKVLENKYISDRERLEAKTEAAVYIEKQMLANCPVCGNDLPQDEEIDIETIIQSGAAEITKINSHLSDLHSTISSVQIAIDNNSSELSLYENEISQIDALLEENVGNKLKENRKLLAELDIARKSFRKKRDLEQKRSEILSEIGRLQVAYDEISDTYTIEDFSKEAHQLAKQISNILVRWDFPNGQDTIFDLNTRDVVVGNKPRSHFGKGYRAICFSAFIIGLMEYLVPQGRHPGFVILDSPLTTYRKRDEAMQPDNDEVVLANNLIYAFYRDLCDFYGHNQIIVLDNQEPDQDLIPKMNYIHFSQNEDIGRYGFFPIN